jgi:hypothetical protein
MVKYLSFHNSSFVVRYVSNVNGKARVVTHPLFPKQTKKRMLFIVLTNPPMFGDANLW